MKPAGLLCFLTLILILSLPSAGLAEESAAQQPAAGRAEQPEAEPLRPANLLSQLGYDLLYVACAPFRLGPLGWGATAAVGGSIYLAEDNRRPIQDWWQDEVRSQTTDDISWAVREWGNTLTPPILAGTFLAGGLLSGRAREVETGVMLAESCGYTIAFITLGQVVLSEERPNDGGDSHFMNGEIGHGVSGHAALAACMAGPLNRQYLQLKASDSAPLSAAKVGGKLLLYGLPVLVGLSRVNDNEHFLWNVMAGWAIGYTMGELIPNAHEARRQGRSWWVGPLVDGRPVGVALRIQN